MISAWHNCKNILVIRPDNMGDVIMMSPALCALKQTFGCRITLLTSKMGSLITPHISYIDETLVYDLPWVKTSHVIQPDGCLELISKLKVFHFDGAIISTVYSQNPLPAAMLAYMAEIPLRVAWCRENPYELLTDWLPDKEPYSLVQHQVTRELNLVAHIGAYTDDKRLSLSYTNDSCNAVINKLVLKGVNINKPWVIIHPGVSEPKREYPEYLWIKTAKRLYLETGLQILITGSSDQKKQADQIQQASAKGIISVAGLFTIDEFIALIALAQLVVSVNTSAVHIAAAVGTPVIVLYAQTNPQHTPWKVSSVVLPFTVPADLQSKNEVIQYAHKTYSKQFVDYPSPEEIVKNALSLISSDNLKKLSASKKSSVASDLF